MASINKKSQSLNQISNTLSAGPSPKAMSATNAAYATLNNVWNSTPTYTFGTGYEDIFSSTNNFLLFVGKYFSEEEIEKLLTDISERAHTINEDIKNDFGKCIRVLVRTRHFSEEFLLKYYEHLTKADILLLHTPDISSGTYAQLTLLLTNDDSKMEERAINRWNNLDQHWIKCII